VASISEKYIWNQCEIETMHYRPTQSRILYVELKVKRVLLELKN